MSLATVQSQMLSSVPLNVGVYIKTHFYLEWHIFFKKTHDCLGAVLENAAFLFMTDPRSHYDR